MYNFTVGVKKMKSEREMYVYFVKKLIDCNVCAQYFSKTC